VTATGISRHPNRDLTVLGYACVSYTLAQVMLFPALPALIDGLQTNANDVAWTLTAFFLSAAVATPILGRLGDMFGTRRMLVVSMSAFTIGALISAVSTDLWMMVGGRVLAGIGGGVFPLSFSMARELVPPGRVPRTVGLLAATMSSGSAVGLVMGGVVVDHLPWQWIFWVTALMGIAATIALRLLPESPLKSGGRVDMRGAVVLAVGLTIPLFAISRAAVWGWTDPRTVGLIAAGLLVLAGWVRLELHTTEPLADITALKSPPVLVTNLAALPAALAPQAMLVLVVLIAEGSASTSYGFGLGATGAGLMLMPGALLGMVAGPLSGALGMRVGNKIPLALGGFIATVALVLVGLHHGTVAEVTTFAALVFGGFGLAIAALPNLIIEAVPPSITGESLAFNALVTRVSYSLGVQVTATIVAANAVVGSTLPTNEGYEIACFVAAAAALVGAVVALLIPRVPARDRRLAQAAGSGDPRVARTA
jgi:MFS family permease